MKKIISLMVVTLVLFSLSFVMAAQDGDSAFGEGRGVAAESGEYVGQQGQEMKIQKQANNQFRLEVGGVYADCECDLTQEEFEDRTKLHTQLSNGVNAEIKIMPDVASETALQRLRLKDCGEDCVIELKEVGSGEQTKLAYEMKTQRQSKVFGLFNAQMSVSAQVNAETGEIIAVKKPWWAFLASESTEEAE